MQLSGVKWIDVFLMCCSSTRSVCISRPAPKKFELVRARTRKKVRKSTINAKVTWLFAKCWFWAFYRKWKVKKASKSHPSHALFHYYSHFVSVTFSLIYLRKSKSQKVFVQFADDADRYGDSTASDSSHPNISNEPFRGSLAYPQVATCLYPSMANLPKRPTMFVLVRASSRVVREIDEKLEFGSDSWLATAGPLSQKNLQEVDLGKWWHTNALLLLFVTVASANWSKAYKSI